MNATHWTPGPWRAERHATLPSFTIIAPRVEVLQDAADYLAGRGTKYIPDVEAHIDALLARLQGEA